MKPCTILMRPSSRAVRLVLARSIRCQASSVRQFSTTKDQQAKNRIYTAVRTPDEFQSYLLLSTSSRTPLITFWTVSYCSTCRAVSPILNELISAGVGEDEGGVAFCEVEYESHDILNSGLGMTYMITSMPTLLSFDRGEAQTSTKVTDPKKMTDKEWLKEWIRMQVIGGGNSGGNEDVNTGLFGGLFGNKR